MGFQKVYKCLMQIFPQVDSRILKAVAIENSKDVDAAAEIVISEILPYMSRKTVAASSSSRKPNPRLPPSRAFDEEEGNQLRQQKVLLVNTACSPTDPLSESNEVLGAIGLAGATTGVGSVEASSAASTSKIHENNNNEPADVETDELILLGTTEKCAEIGKAKSIVSLSALGIDNLLPYVNLEIKGSGSKDQTVAIEDGIVRTPHASPDTADNSTSLLENTDSSGSYNDILNLYGPVDLNAVSCRNSSFNGILIGEENAEALLVPSSSLEQMAEALGAGLHSEINDHSTGSEKLGGGSIELKSQQDPISDMGNIEDDTINPVVSRSSQTCRIDLREEVIEDAKNSEKNLFQAMQSILDLMREVVLQEEAAELAKEECTKGGLDILVKVEELRQMLAHVKHANDMHAGQVFGEKAILVAEGRELQSRLFSLSEERDKSLSILDEMRQTLEARVAAAKELMKVAEQEKLEKEESALGALAKQEAIMSKVVQESKILQQEAEENSKLREFLMDHGQIVDSLQGEISVICQDVRLLKEKFDQCISSSKSSSLESTAGYLGTEQGETAKTLEKRSLTPPVDVQSPKSRSSDEWFKADDKDLIEWYKADDKELIDEEWEFFDDAEFNIAAQ
ncbi:uncharacterized protein LOC120182063 [Hibiscus syriacus]|uniref:uncharacterized protein LOC120182063 n=1 Tax=Hibiscus syriacus TaxID=106335 RepID=UPI001923201F|nr:uncharacterized protein LOC120182063 [Hibiscus syriacus]